MRMEIEDIGLEISSFPRLSLPRGGSIVGLQRDQAAITAFAWNVRRADRGELVQAPEAVDESLLAEGYREMYSEDREAAERDMHLGFEALPEL